MKERKKIFHESNNQKGAAVAVLILNKKDFKFSAVIRDKKKYTIY